MARSAAGISAIPIMVPQMSGLIPRCSPTNTFIPCVQLIGKLGLVPSAPGPLVAP